MAPFPSRDRSRAAILGASSAGWSSPSKAASQETSGAMSVAKTASGSGPNGVAKTMPEHRATLGSLRSHGLVSNSVFKSTSGSPTSAQSSSPQGTALNASPTARSAASQRFGFGLGISASPAKGASSGLHKSPSSRNVNGSTSDAENEHESSNGIIYRSTDNASRKSQGIKRLQDASYVTQSPFRQSENDGDRSLDQAPELPDNAWAKTAAAVMAASSPARPSRSDARPSTPERTPLRTATAHAAGDVDLGTPTSGTPRSVQALRTKDSRTDSPSGRGLLVYNRLHGPRTMSNGGAASDSPMSSPTRQERRKTVTFDEVLDVQEFDRESSFGHESMQSMSSNTEMSASDNADADKEDSPDMWLSSSRDHGAEKVVERLIVVNGSPDSVPSEFSTPELSNLVDEHMDGTNVHEADSSSADSQDEPQSPRPDEVSFERVGDKTFNTAPDQSHYQDSVYADPEADVSGGNLSAYAASHRVDNLVDELLGDSLLGSKRQAALRKSTQEAREQREAKEAASKPLASAPKVGETLGLGDLRLDLPEWSPIMSDSGLSAADEIRQQRASRMALMSGAQSMSPRAEIKPSPSGRPHISRDAILQRVAREKQMQQEQEKVTDSPQPLVEESATAGSMLRGPAVPVKVLAAPKLVRQPTDEAQRSPLERLTAEVAAEQAQAAEANLSASAAASAPEASTAPALRQDGWFANASTEESTASDVMTRNSMSPSTLALTPAQQAEQIIARRRSKNGRAGPSAPTRQGLRPRRSLSDGNISQSTVERETRHAPMSSEFDENRIAADTREEELIRQKHFLDSSLKLAVEPGFESHLEREISRIYRQGNEKYHVQDRGTFASSSGDDQVSHSTQAGDVASGKKAWRKLRRPSDMNEYAKEMREIRAKENPKKATGKVFVVVDSFTPTTMPVPAKPTRFYCILDNGLHVVRTATAGLRSDGSSKIGQEFELIQHKNLEFSLTLVAQRDAHLHEPEHKPSSPSASSRRERLTPSFSRGMGKLFSSPKKKLALSNSSSTMDGRGPTVEPMIAYLNREGAFGQCNVVFEKIAQDCLARCHVMDIPVRGVNDPPASSLSSTTSQMSRADFSRNLGAVRGTLRLKVFYLPPLVGIAKTLLPDNLNDCVKGMEMARWHMGQPWKEGTLTQLGGDCRTWRRRPMKLQGANLVCYNEVTKKATVKIDLTKATCVEENTSPVDRDNDQYDETYHVERSFRVLFKDGERIAFFADTDAEMHDWMAAMRKIVGNSQIPQPSLWAQMVLELVQSTQTAKQQGLLSSASATITSASSQPMSAAPSSSGTSTTSTSSMSKRVPAPPAGELTASGDGSDATQTPARTHQIPQSRSRPLSMAVPQLTAVREVSTPDDTPTKMASETKPASPVTPATQASVSVGAPPVSPQKTALPAIPSTRPRPQSMYSMPAGSIAERPGVTSTPARIQMQHGSPVRKLPIPSGAAMAAVASLPTPAPSRPLPASTTTSPRKGMSSTPIRSTRPLPPPVSAIAAERPTSVYHDRRA